MIPLLKAPRSNTLWLIISFILSNTPGMMRPPNLVIIMADDMGWNGLTSCGSDLVRTPHIDRLAAEGMRFTNAYALSQCLPTRAAIFSG